uniref:cDNA FLJ53524 n=1 Tax=Homo sapiens TaxID=9606 RepID=B7Z3P2_HUMAN|nr:unnamed protein product [Homo sapiens]
MSAFCLSSSSCSCFSSASFMPRHASISRVLALSRRRLSDTSSLAARTASVFLAALSVSTVKRLLNHSSAFCMFLAASFSYCARMSLSAAERSGLVTSISTEICAYWICACSSAISSSCTFFRKEISSIKLSMRFSSSARASAASSAPLRASISRPSASSRLSTSSS